MRAHVLAFSKNVEKEAKMNLILNL
jgi:hypothetical protein